MIRFREITNTDFSAFQEAFSKFSLEEFPEYSLNIRKHFTGPKYIETMFKYPIKIGAFDSGKLIGYLVGLNPIGGVLNIFWLAVSTSYQGKGVGTKLLYMVGKLGLKLGAHSLQLQADKRNLTFYKNRGYEIIGLDTHGYYGTDNYLMKRIIQKPTEKNFLR